MKAITWFIGLSLLLPQLVQAQFFGEMDWQKKKYPSVITEVNQPVAITTAAIQNKFTQMGLKGRSEKGALVYKGIQIAEIGAETYDVVVKVDKKGKKSNETSVVHFAVSRGNENYITGTDDPELVNRIKAYTGNFQPWASEQSLLVDIQKQEDAVKSAEKKLKDLEDEASSLQRRKQKLEDDIKENGKNIEKQRAEIENQRKALDVLRSKKTRM
ncbi:MAG TPA: hypothetical protein PKE63_02750 [Lacibacter sp.]|nr:hypothetical protein [Lacibacter sp.]HMO88051.1 hypothetical protein [Lacibacter sp.]HMP86166.1 hypothetical protein [Lacibacter sp.]